ncbi:YcnI family copper-binding membrane protein [Frankia sp. AgKG'84/4]|uniref:YcnI family copper-binding membrane protein n=1 Tax=Frankia sp. AgKG'84/4 TaxID=573490 RepID=UPI00200EB9B2|nr:YcnI family protein [Frankia sp. AgKG'84/4]MCL9794338.1 YcnI family protein [Frankia sp. AgKG'84/4]
MRRVFSRAGILVAATGVTVVATVLPASAHVTVQPSTAAPGSYSTLVFKVPTEKDDASTTGLDVQLPTDNPIASVSVQPKAGWTYKVTKAKPSKPLTTDDGAVDEVVTRITWTADPGSPGIKPGEFDTFTVSAGPLPEKADSIAFKALQNYSNGDVVRWVDVPQAGAAEPEHPAPTITLTSATATAGAEAAHTTGTATAAAAPQDSDDGTARTLGTVGIVVGALGLLVGGFGLARARRRA